jgi:hypothetical protein
MVLYETSTTGPEVETSKNLAYILSSGSDVGCLAAKSVPSEVEQATNLPCNR